MSFVVVEEDDPVLFCSEVEVAVKEDSSPM